LFLTYLNKKGLYKVNLSNTPKIVKIREDFDVSTDFNVNEKYVFFATNLGIKRIDYNGNNEKLIVKGNFNNIVVYEKILYLRNNSNTSIYSIDENGNGYHKIN
jgi:hypothetical protein